MYGQCVFNREGNSMKHCIIVKFTESVKDKAGLIKEIESVFRSEEKPEGVSGYEFVSNCVERANRYDLAIVITMDKSALPVWDSSRVHHRWKDEFGANVAQKAIFDYEV